MKITKSYTCLISGTDSKMSVLENQLSLVEKLSKFVYENTDLVKDHNLIYKVCRQEFPGLNSKALQNFLRYMFWRGGKKPKSAPKASIFIDSQNFGVIRTDNSWATFWCRMFRTNFALRGKYLESRILEPENIKLIQIFKRRNRLYAKLSYVQEVSDIQEGSEGPGVGLDMNFRTVVLSDNSFFPMKQLAHRKLEHKKNKQELGNFTKDFVSKLTTEIANYLHKIGTSCLVLEDLKHLRNSCRKKGDKPKGKLFNYIVNSMPYSMVANQLVYKCLDRNIEVKFINPAYTSKMCSKCGSLDTARPTQNRFVCKNCNLRLHADLNAARNIRTRGISSTNGLLETTALLGS